MNYDIFFKDTLPSLQAIFSDDSDDEGETSSLDKAGDPEKKVEAANTTLNRLRAGDFLESLGKELGLEVPPDVAYATNDASKPDSHKEIVNASSGNAKTLSESPVHHGVPDHQERAEVGVYKRDEIIHSNSAVSSSKLADTGPSEAKYDIVNSENVLHEDRKAKTPLSQNWGFSSSSSSEDERSRKRVRRHQHRSSDSDSDSSSDDQGAYHSSSKGRRKGSSREKSRSSKKHSKHHKHRSRDSHGRSRHRSEKEHAEARREKHKRRN